MLLTVFSLLSYLVLIISAAPGYVQEKRPGYSSSYYPGRKNVSPRSVAINNRYPHAIRTRNPQGGGGHKHHYGGPQPILQTATTLINVHPTNGYRKCPPDANQDDCNPPARMAVVEPPSTLPPPPPQTEPPMQTEPPHPTTTPCPKTTTTTELNIYQGNNKVVELRARLPTDAPAYPTYQPPPPPPPPVYQPPPPPVYQPPPPPPPPRYVPPPPRYTPPPPPEVTEAPYHRPGETVIRIGPKDDDYGKKKYKVLICKLQKD